MGRSVSRPMDAIVVCYRDVSEITESYEWDDFIDWVQWVARDAWPSIRNADKWLGREDHVIAENDHAMIGVSEYCGLASVWLVSKGESYLNTGYSDDVRAANIVQSSGTAF